MIKVTIDLIPYGDENKTETISELLIANVGGTFEEGNYEVIGYEIPANNPFRLMGFTLDGFNREQGVLDLLRLVLMKEFKMQSQEHPSEDNLQVVLRTSHCKNMIDKLVSGDWACRTHNTPSDSCPKDNRPCSIYWKVQIRKEK